MGEPTVLNNESHAPGVKLHFSVSCLLRSIQLRVALRVFAVLARHGLAMEDD